MVVEDDPTNATLREVILGHEGFEITVRRRAEEALVAAEKSRYVLFVVELALSGSAFDGVEVIRRLKTNPKTSKTPIIACTAALLRFEDTERYRRGRTPSWPNRTP